MRSSASR